MANGPFYESGKYIGKVIQQGFTKAKTGTTQFVLRVKVLGYPNEDGSYTPDAHQYERTIYMPITDKTIDFVAQTLEYLGYNRPGFGPLDPSHPQHQSFVDNQVDLYCAHEADQNGEQRERWRIDRGMGSGAKLDPLSPKEVRELDALFGKAIRPAGTSAPSTPSPAKSNPNDFVLAGTEITDDDIPF